jgi:UDP-N-acetylmuramoylalanine--D-glutamate ligase
VNADDPVVLAEARRARARQLLFRVTGEPLASGDGAFFEGGAARLRQAGRLETLFVRADVVLPGAHLHGDLLVAAAAARLLGARAEAIARAVRGFRGVEHVLEHVAVDGIAFYDDSKATNVDAARRSLEAFSAPVVVILGGRYGAATSASFSRPLRPRPGGGGDRRKRRNASLALSRKPPARAGRVIRMPSVRALARRRDVVLLAPACSSFDMFRDYAERGRAFKAEVARLSGEAASARGSRG